MSTCAVLGCDRLTQRAAGKGRSPLYCNMHVQRFARTGTHIGSPLKGYQVAPYRRAARAWLKSHPSAAKPMLDGVSLALRSGNAEAMALWGSKLGPGSKAAAVRGWLHAAGVMPEDVLAMVLGIVALCRQRGVISAEYIQVQVGRAMMRKHGPQARSPRVHASGRVLRYLGKQFTFFVGVFADSKCFTEIAKAATPMAITAEEAERRRKERQAVRAKTQEAIARRIMQARNFGAGPQELERLRSDLTQRYGLSQQ